MTQPVNCSKCDKPSAHSISVRNTSEPPPQSGEKDLRGVRVIRLCEEHWAELKELLPAA